MKFQFDRPACQNLRKALRKEWLETNGLGDYASSSLVCCNTRKYHGLFVTELARPAGRHVMLSTLEESLLMAGKEFFFSCRKHPGVYFPRGHEYMQAASAGLWPSFRYRFGDVTLTRELKRRGISVVTRASVDYVDTGANLGATVHYRQGGGEEERTAYGEVVLAAIGRMPNTDAGWFASNGIELEERGYVSTDAYGRTNVEGVWALGDITPGHALAHRAFEQGITIAETIAGLDPKPVSDETVPQVVFSFPEAASVGLALDDAKSCETIINPQETAYPMLSNSRMLMSGEGGSMTIVSGAMAGAPDVPLVLGVHIVSPLASDLIAEAEQLVGNRVPLAAAARLIHPHPTFSESFGEALLKADGRPLHTR